MNQQPSGPKPAVAIHELSRNRRIGILLICSISLFIVGLDITAVNVALPSIGQDLDAGLSGLAWTVDAYTVVMASLLMFSGSVADRLGRQRIFVAGLALSRWRRSPAALRRASSCSWRHVCSRGWAPRC